MSETQNVSTQLMPEDTDSISHPDQDRLTDAVIGQINDNTDDNKSLRELRSKAVVCLAILAAVFYVALLIFIYCILFCDKVHATVGTNSTVYIAILIILAMIPTVTVMQVAKAIFARKLQSSAVTYTPLQAIIKFMKEFNSQN